jgi:hypothetical protein
VGRQRRPERGAALIESGLLVVDTSWLPSASVVERGQANAARDSLWIGRP